MPKTPQPFSDHFVIERSSPVPLYHQIAEQLEHAIYSGMLQPEQRIDNELELVKKLSVSRPTIRQAIDVLVKKGLLVRKRGIGTQVASNIIKRQIKLSSLYDDLKKLGRSPATRVLEYSAIVADSELAQRLELGAEKEVVYLERLRLAESVPLALMKNWIPPQIVGFTVDQLESSGLYALLRASGHSPKVAKQRFSAVSAEAKHAELLMVEVGTPLLSMTETVYDESGRPIECADHLYIADSYAVEITVAEQ